MSYATGMRVYDHTRSEWGVAAERWLRLALDNVISGRDAIPAADAALAALRMEAGEVPPDPYLLETEEEDALP